MNRIRIGTCVPGGEAEKYIPPFVEAGFECLSLNFHMEFQEGSLKEYSEQIKRLTNGNGHMISSIGYYCNPLQNEEQRKTLEAFIDNAALFGTSVVTTFAGALEGESVEAALPQFKKVFQELAQRAEAQGVKIAIENCPMGGTWQKATCNIGFCPSAWEKMFGEVDSPNLGLEWEPAHQMIQLIDPLPQISQWSEKIFHIHGKDATVNWNEIKKLGIFGCNEFAVERTPGFGDTDWRDVFYALYQNGYAGDLCVEGFHDPIYCGTEEMTGQLHALKYLKWCRGGDFVPNPF